MRLSLSLPELPDPRPGVGAGPWWLAGLMLRLLLWLDLPPPLSESDAESLPMNKIKLKSIQ